MNGLPVTVSITRLVDPDKIPDVTRWVQAGVNLANRYPGFLGSGWVRASRDSEEWHMLYRFADRELLDAWEGSPERLGWLEEGAGLVVHQRTERRTGIEGWFDRPTDETGPIPTIQTAPPRWKQSVSIWLGFFPVNLAFNLLVGWLYPAWGAVPVLPRILITTVVLVPIMTFWVLPWITRTLQPWLSRGR